MRVKCLCLFVFLTIFLTTICDAGLALIPLEVKSPPVFSFTEIDPNSIVLEYMARMERYDVIISSSPIPVFIMPQAALPNKFYPQSKGIFGLYVDSHSNELWPEKFIFINSVYSAEQIITSYFHEIEHYVCSASNCICSNKDKVLMMDDSIISAILREKHAMVNELTMSWEAKDSKLIAQSLTTISRYIISENPNLIYKMAAISATKDPIWDKSYDYLKKLE